MNGAAARDSGVVHGPELIAFAEAAIGGDDVSLARARSALRAVLTPEAYVEVAAVIAAFSVVDRIADATGIPVDEMMLAMSGEVRTALRLERFASSANTRQTA